MRRFHSPEDLNSAVGTRLGESNWLLVEQSRIDQFAAATGDTQWIHVDPERAHAGPFGRPIAHGFLTLSLLVYLNRQVFSVENLDRVVNYGLNRVRFIEPVPVGSRIRARTDLVQASESGGGIQVVMSSTVEIDGVERPALVAESISRYYFSAGEPVMCAEVGPGGCVVRSPQGLREKD